MDKEGNTVVIVCGGSGGHIFPAVSLSQVLRATRPGIVIVFMCSRSLCRADHEIIETAGTDNQIVYLAATRVTGNWLYNLILLPLRCTGQFIRSLIILKKFRPSVMIGFGGLMSVAPLVAGKLLGIRTVIHEQNMIPGRANRLLGSLVDRVAVSIAATREWFREDKVVVTGNPVRSTLKPGDRDTTLRKWGLDAAKFTVLVFGGSQGAESINTALLGALDGFDLLADEVQLIHITGTKNYEYAVSRWGGRRISAVVRPFVEEMGDVYSCADLVVCRAGAGTITELASFGLPAILVPYPYSHDGHQTANAQYVEHGGAGSIIHDDCLTAESILEEVRKLLHDRDNLRRMAERSKNLAVHNGAEKLAACVLAKMDGGS